ncbi:MAG TPA: pyroglutamyl-peptidase I [Aliidongia sp.]|uniref:pyroglutamyl-peptidase I n=1 Tax=Aliidongia sp. TaxID=1914230 RepID=UPI002DDD44F3|nr:pyroglutamyl-peptidase I [Aliidongia sp.]HEV2677907.1 pyroglutamyl-peptidase I [Aliidongia sp.]
MRILVTGFEPFGGEPVNPALEAVLRLPSMLGAHTIERRLLPAVFHRALDVLGDAVRTTRPDILLCVGQAGGRTELSIERVAINVDDARIPDNDGGSPIDRPIVPGGPAAYFTNLPLKAMVRALSAAGIPAKVSNTAGTFVCNHVFYGSMHLVATEFPAMRAGFIHIPFLPEQVTRHPGQPSMAVETVVAGLVLAIEIATGRTDDIAVADGATH